MRNGLALAVIAGLALGLGAVSPAASNVPVRDVGSVSAESAATSSQGTQSISTRTRTKSKLTKAQKRCATIKRKKGKARCLKRVKKAKLAAARRAAAAAHRAASQPVAPTPGPAIQQPVSAPPVGGGTAPLESVETAPPTSVATTKPSASNTGVPSGTELTVLTGNLTITTPGTIIDSLDIRGFVTVKAPNVTIKRSVIRGPSSPPTVSSGLLSIVTAGATGFVIEDVTLVPQVSSGYIDAIKVNQSGVFRRLNVSGTSDGMVIYGDNISVYNSHFHNFLHLQSDPRWGGGPSHDDAIQVQAGRNVLITGNNLEGAYNAAVQVTQDAGVTQNLKINNNWLDGGGCTVNYKSNGSYKTGMEANNNRFGRDRRVADCAVIHNSAASDLVPTGNVWDATGQPATIKRGS